MKQIRNAAAIPTVCLALAACTSSLDTDVATPVRGFGWVETIDPVELTFVGGRHTSNECSVNDGSNIRVDSAIATVEDTESIMLGITGTACPKGAKFIVTEALSTRLDRARAEHSRFMINVQEANDLSGVTTGETVQLRGWFDTINQPVQQYRSMSTGVFETKMGLGDSCLVEPSAPVTLLGRLSTGDYAARVESKVAPGTPCPDGAIIIVDQNEIHR